MVWAGVYVQHAATLLGGVLVFLAFELALPRSRSGWAGRLQAAVFLIVSLAGATSAVFLASALQGALHIEPLISVRLPWPVAVLLAPLIGDLFYYWFHRAQHAVPALWRFHSVHHAIRDLSAVNSYHHWTEELLRVFFVTLPLAALIRIDYAVLPLVAFVMGLQGHLIHANTRVNLGPLNRLLGDNRTHRVHHSTEERHFGKNYGSFSTVWDQLFGTAYFPERGEWPDVGLANRPEAASLREYVLASAQPPSSARRGLRPSRPRNYQN